ncbi:J domain-containing protein [Tundrisphaera sp. TA3]|uniref:J domain-containing protein n=1 Tax=Tundrisphaera sp. TA3 TaxID=3435775 RepID=UPI003EB6C6D0
MMHTFQFDPFVVLGVSADATLQEIRDAYHKKSKKYHPDLGGDEWAFRVIARAYEVLSTARVVGRAGADVRPAEAPRAPEPPSKKTSWASNFRPGPSATPPPHAGHASPTGNLSGWGGAQRSHAGAAPGQLARIVAAELLILRFELDSTFDLFARNPEDRNLSCNLHVTWPLDEADDRVAEIPEAPKIIKALSDAFKIRGVRKHALTKRVEATDVRFSGWLTFATAVMASEALEAFREALIPHGLTVEKQVREMAIPRQWG